MNTSISRRRFLGSATAATAFSILPLKGMARPAEPASAEGFDFKLTDFHVHLDNSTIDKALDLPAARAVKFGIVEHAGTRENKYPVVLSNDAELEAYLAKLEGKPVYKGVQAEWIDWMSCFSRETLGKLDYVLSDAMTFPGNNGRRIKLWEKDAEIGEPQSFMDRYVDWHVEVMAKEPLDIFANTTWLPDALIANYDALWTTARMEKVIQAALKYRVALEISSSYKLPRLPFLKMAKAAGSIFSFGSNGRYPNMGKLDYCLEIARVLGAAIRNRAIEPQAVVSVTQQRTSLISVLGEVNSPTRLTAAAAGAGDRILDAITRAGGIKGQGFETWVMLERNGTRATVPFENLVMTPSNNIYVQPGDRIYVYREQQKFIALGATGQSGEFNFDAWRINLAEAVGKAGGLLDSNADPDAVFMYRAEPRDVAERLGVDVSKFPGAAVIPVIFSVNFRDPGGFFLATKTQMRNGDIIFVSNARSVEVTKFLNYLRVFMATASDGVNLANDGIILRNNIKALK